MSKRMQVLVDEPDLERFQQICRQRGLTLAAWVRQTLREAAREESVGPVDERLQALRRAAEHEFPATDVDQMLREIEAGYAEERQA